MQKDQSRINESTLLNKIGQEPAPINDFVDRQNELKLKILDNYATYILVLYLFATFATIVIIILQGLSILDLPETTVNILSGGTICEAAGLLYLIIKTILSKHNG